MNQKIASFVDTMTENDQKYVREWAYATLEHKPIESATQILSIILLKLMDTSDKELIRLLYTVLSGRLTYEDFNSLSLYIFKGKPPLSKDLFYNITERVFINKKTALLKALSVTSIISEADPELTIFYMTMLLCRVDLNNENRAMLNLLLYCIDADIPTEVASSVRTYLLSNKDILEEIFSSEKSPEVQEIVEKVKIQLERESRDHGFISIKSRGADKNLKNEDLSRENDFQIPPGDEKQVVTLEGSSVAGIVVNDPPEKKPSARGVDAPSEKYTEDGDEESFLQEAVPETPVIPAQTQKTINSSNPVSEKTVTFPESEKKKKSSGKTHNAKKNQKRGTIREETPGVLLQEAPESPILSSPPTENDEHYELKLRKFKLTELLSDKKTEHKTLKSKKLDRNNRLKRKRVRILYSAVILTVIALAGWFLINNSRKPVYSVPSVSEKVVTPAIKTKVNNTSTVTEAYSGWKLKETNRGYEWTVQKGESVWRLHEYLTTHSAELPEPLQLVGDMDWIPFIKQVIALNPRKNFADFIEPGEVFLILRTK